MGFRAFYGDLSTPRVFAIDVDSMTRIVNPDIAINSPAYPVDKVHPKLLYGVTRGEKSVTPIDLSKYAAGAPVRLSHKPRSTTIQRSASKHFCLVAGADQPVTSVVEVESSTVLQVVGQPTGETDTDYGGGLASGHPIWVGKKHFLLLDRRRRTISLYRLQKNLPLATIRASTRSAPASACAVRACRRSPMSLPASASTSFCGTRIQRSSWSTPCRRPTCSPSSSTKRSTAWTSRWKRKNSPRRSVAARHSS